MHADQADGRQVRGHHRAGRIVADHHAGHPSGVRHGSHHTAGLGYDTHARYAAIGDQVQDAFRRYAEDVRRGAFPGPEQCYPIDEADEAEIRRARLALSAPEERVSA